MGMLPHFLLYTFVKTCGLHCGVFDKHYSVSIHGGMFTIRYTFSLNTAVPFLQV